MHHVAIILLIQFLSAWLPVATGPLLVRTKRLAKLTLHSLESQAGNREWCLKIKHLPSPPTSRCSPLKMAPRPGAVFSVRRTRRERVRNHGMVKETRLVKEQEG